MTNEESITSNFKSGSESSENLSVPPKEKKDWIAEGILWYATPKALRDPKTATTFCKLHGVPYSTFKYEMAKAENQEQIIDLCFKQAKKRTPEILEKLGQKAEEGNDTSIAQFLEFVLERKKKLELSGDKNNPIPIEVSQLKVDEVIKQYLNGDSTNTTKQG